MKVNLKLLLFPLVVLLVDQLIKFYVFHNLSVDFILAKFLQPELNSRLAFSLPSSNLFAIILSVFAILALIYLINYSQDLSIKKYFAIILGAGSSNLIDRITYGGVRDYINFFNLSLINLADVLIIGAIIVIILNKYKLTKT